MWAATAVSSAGDGLALVAFPLVAATLTRDPRLIAGVAVAQRLPWLLLSLPAGALADRLSRRRLLAVVELARMTVIAGLALSIATGHSHLAAVYAGAFALGSLETGFAGATLAALPDIVTRRNLPRANGFLFAAQTSGEQFVGPAVGGAVFVAAASLPFFADAVTFAASALLLMAAIPRRASVSVPGPRHSIHADVAEGVRWFLRTPSARRLAAVVTGFAFCQAMVLGILVLFCLETLHLGPAGYGIFLAVGAVGNVAGGAVAGRVHDRLGTRIVLIGGGLAAAGAYVAVGLAPAVWIAATAFMVEAAAVALGNVASVSMRQEIIPGEMLGRVGNVFRMCIFGVMPFGAIAGGLLAGAFGLRAPMVIAGVLQGVVVLATRRGLAAAD